MAITAEPTGGTPTTGAGEGRVLLIDLDQIRTDGNVRELAQDEVEGLAGSIELLGQITPVFGERDAIAGSH